MTSDNKGEDHRADRRDSPPHGRSEHLEFLDDSGIGRVAGNEPAE
jgi:hypothetical protein